MSRVSPHRSQLGPRRDPAHVVQLAQRFMRAHLCDTVSLADLAAAVGCRPRTLIRAFSKVVGEPPMAHFRRLRLEELRRRLLAAPADGAHVLDLATECGFWHLGHLGIAYKSRFGETPRQTLTNRSAQENRLALHR